METLERVIKPVKEIDLFIVDRDLQFGQTIKDSLEKEFHEHLFVKYFLTGESLIEEISRSVKKPNIVILDYFGNKSLNKQYEKHTVDAISVLSPDTGIIIVSDKMHEDRAMKALAHGAHDFVLKDKFAVGHLVNAVKKVLNPPKL
jgi:DNA-binding NarL/FixJ family response regulator